MEYVTGRTAIPDAALREKNGLLKALILERDGNDGIGYRQECESKEGKRPHLKRKQEVRTDDDGGFLQFGEA